MASSSSCINNFKPFPSQYRYHATCNHPFLCKALLLHTVSSSKQLSQRLNVATSVAFNPSGNYEMSLFDDENDTSRVSPPEPPKAERYEVVIDNDTVKRLDISPFQAATGVDDLPSSAELKELLERTVGFTINFEREEYDSRELSELPEIRLWFVHLDATYPWLPVMLDWRGGELARYAAMLVPHQVYIFSDCILRRASASANCHMLNVSSVLGLQMSMRMGVVFNPEALELFVMNKVFIVYSYLKKMKVPKPRLKTADMAKMLGFGIGDELFDLIDQQRYTSIDD